MSTCADICARSIPPSIGAAGCDIKTRKGGFNRFVIASCAACLSAQPYADGQINEEAWQELIDDCLIRISPLVQGSKETSDTNTQRLTSCGGEVPISRTHNFNFQWRSFTENNTEFDYLDVVERNPSNFKIGVFGCPDPDNGGELFYGFYDLYAFTAEHTVPDNNQEIQQFDISVQVQKLGQLKPIPAPGLAAFLTEYADFDCGEGGSGYDPEVAATAEALGLTLCAA